MCLPNGLRRGFTLIELLVAISIIAMLIALLLPALKAARYTSHDVACRSNLRQLAIAAHSYAVDTNGILPHNGGDAGGAAWEKRGYHHLSPFSSQWDDKVRRYTSTPGGRDADTLLHCPALARSGIERDNTFDLDYSLNEFVGGRRNDNGGNHDPQYPAEPVSEMLTSRLLWFADGRALIHTAYYPGDFKVLSAFDPSKNHHDTFSTTPAEPWTNTHPWPFKWPDFLRGHGDGEDAHYLFGDGHVESWDLDQVLAVRNNPDYTNKQN